ncbi:hypothetical protein [Streptomyces sp. NRRL F-2747]|uniref:hypothetical protein n=1 Tax=Streptomyces sp. NRRL F-2747 TaxID=1463843 RepID=UPI00099C42DF|nr:hypothetical protein [Streptomyces sp. NRRL F-2747]
MSTDTKPSTRRPRSTKPAPVPPACDTCDGTGETTTTVRVGRKRREIGAIQTGLCPACLGTGTA